MHDKHEIILRHFRDGESKSEISRRLGISRGTVRKYIEEYSRSKETLLNEQVADREELIESLVESPRYNSSTRKKRTLTGEIVSRVKECLEENRKKRSRGQHTQQMKTIDMHELLQQPGHDIGYSSVCTVINELESRGRESVIRQDYDYGPVCECDWGEVTLFIGDRLRRLQMAVFTSATGNDRSARLCVKQDTASFQHSHALCFDRIGGVYRELVYANMRVAVKRFTGHCEKEATQGLLSLSAYYLFRVRVCHVCRGHEKGHVENRVEYVRRKAFSTADKFLSVDGANERLLGVCDDVNARRRPSLADKSSLEILSAEQAYLLPLPPMFECGEFQERRVDTYSTISIDTCRYSVPETCVEKLVMVKVSPERIVCDAPDKPVCEHRRHDGFHEWSIELEHDRHSFTRKPGALAGSVALRQSAGAVKALYDTYSREHPKDFIELLVYMKDSGKDIHEMTSAVQTLEGLSAFDGTLDKIRVVCERQREQKVGGEAGEIVEVSLTQ
ncbi:MAG: IS21 family transposase [bacterium]|nr:IS21 family transposase [bacterium]